MRWIRLLTALVRARFKSRVDPSATTVLRFRVWLTDIDASIMNHAAMMTVLEAGRVEFMVRTGFFRLARKAGWYFPNRGISIQFYRPLKVFQQAELHTRISYADDKWIYIEQKIIRQGKDIAAALVKSTVKSGRDTVPTQHLVMALGAADFARVPYPLVTAYEQESLLFNERLQEGWKIGTPR